jgi:glycosyltransferase involved in cell wall biosynthesis
MGVISVILPTFNRSRQLERALNSLVAQDFQDFNVIVSDDGSEDDTENIVSKYKNALQITYIKSLHSGIPAITRNLAIESSKSDYLAFLDSDDWWEFNKLSISLEFLRKGYDFVCHPLNIYSEKSKKYTGAIIETRSFRSDVANDLLFYGNCIPTSSVILARKYLMDVGGFCVDPNLRSWEDFDAWIKVASLTNRFFMMSTVLGTYSLSEDSISSTNPEAERKLLIEMKNKHRDRFNKGDWRDKFRYILRQMNCEARIGNRHAMTQYFLEALYITRSFGLLFLLLKLYIKGFR